MIDITKSSFLKYLLFASLYFSQGLQAAIAVVIIPVYLLEKGFPLPLTTLVAGIFMIPWSIKFVWGGIIDYFIRFGRKRFILMGGLLGVVCLFALAVTDPVVALIPFVFLLFLSHLGVSFLDVSADAWAIEISREEERGKINSVMFAGRATGLAIGSSLLAVIAQIFSYSAAFLTAGLLILLIIIFPLMIKEIKIIKKRQKIASLLTNEFRKKTIQLIAVFAPISAISGGLIVFAMPLYMKTILQLDIALIGLITTVFPVATVVGSLVGGVMTDRWGRKTTLYVLIGISVFFTASLIFASSWQILAIIYGIVGFLQGGYIVATLAMCMDITNPRIGATQFSILMSLRNFGEMGGEFMSGTLFAMLGFGRVFLYSAWFLGPALLILYFIKLKKIR